MEKKGKNAKISGRKKRFSVYFRIHYRYRPICNYSFPFLHYFSFHIFVCANSIICILAPSWIALLFLHSFCAFWFKKKEKKKLYDGNILFFSISFHYSFILICPKICHYHHLHIPNRYYLKFQILENKKEKRKYINFGM